MSECQRRVRRRRLLRDVLWHRSSLDRVRKCGRVAIGDGVTVRWSTTAAWPITGAWRRAGRSGRARCARRRSGTPALWRSPTAAGNWHRAGNTVAHGHVRPAPHDLGMPLAALLPVVARGFRRSSPAVPGSGSRSACRSPGTIRSASKSLTARTAGTLTCTAWCSSRATPTRAAAGRCSACMSGSRWRKFITKAGYRPPSDLHGVKIDVCTSAAEAGLYIAKTAGRPVGRQRAGPR